MLPTSHLLAFAITAFVIIVVPGPSVLFAVGRALALGRRASLLTVLGNAAGSALPLTAAAVGLGSVLAASTTLLSAVKLAGAGYLIYLGVRAFRERRSLSASLEAKVTPTAGRRLVRQGFFVGMTNPKTIVFFAAILPQFADRSAGALPAQLLFLGAVFIVIGLVSDSAWALLAGTARNWFARSPRRLEAVGGTGGLMIIGVGATVALTGAKD